MRLETPRCPTCDDPAIGGWDFVSRLCFFDAPATEGDVGCSGEDAIPWDSSVPDTDSEGRISVTCEHRHEWYTAVAD